MNYEALAHVYAQLVRDGKRTLESIKNPIIRERVRQILQEEKGGTK